MRLLANENIPAVAVTALVADGHDVAWVRTAAPGIADSEVLAWAAREGRILLTFDKDFGELARIAKLPSSCGVILFRVPAPPPGEIGPRIAALVTARQDWAGHFSVIEPGRVRMRPLESI
jgi:predicted nuclease of predicted toxin-antitoxin system